MLDGCLAFPLGTCTSCNTSLGFQVAENLSTHGHSMIDELPRCISHKEESHRHHLPHRSGIYRSGFPRLSHSYPPLGNRI